MATSGLDHLKNDYRRRFCRPSRVPDINTVEGQDMLEILQDCFEEESLTNDFSIDSTRSVLYSTPKVKDSCIQPLSKEKSHPKSVPVSSRKKEAPLQGIVEPCETANKSVQAHEVPQKNLTTDVGSRNTPDLKKMSSKKQSGHPSEREAEEEFYLSVGSPAILSDAKTSVSQNTISSLAQKRETYTFGNSLNTLSSSTEISLKTKKRLNFEDKDILEKVEMKNKVSEVQSKIPEGPQERKPSETFQKSVQDLEHEIQPQTKKSFSTLFLETVKRKSEFSPIVRHISTAPPHSSPPNDMKLLEDEFIIDESERSFASRSWITIPRKGGPLKQPIVSTVESTAGLQDKKARKNHCSVSPKTLASDKHLHKAHQEQKFQPCDEKTLHSSSALTNKLENTSKKYEIYSEKAKKPSGNKRTIKQNQRRKFKANRVEEQLDFGQSKDENVNMSHSAQDKLQKSLDRNRDDCEEMSHDHISLNPVPSVGDRRKSRGTKDSKKESRKKTFSSESKKNKLVPEEVTVTVRRSHRISRRPSNWWEVKSEESPVHSNSSINNESSVYHKTRQKSAKKTSQLPKNVGKKPISSKQQKIATQGSSRVQKFLNVKGSKSIISHEKISSSQKEPLESDKADLAKKKNLNCSGTTEHSKDQCGVMSAQNVHLKSQNSDHTCKTATESNLDSGEPQTSVLEESGPSRLKNYLMSGKKNSDGGDEEVQESLDDSRIKRSKVAPKKEIHHKLILPSKTPNVRRTKRIRLKPLEYWRGERIDYQETPSGGFVIGGILSPDIVPSKRKAKGNVGRVNKVTNRKRICLDNDERKNRAVVNLNIPLLGDPLQPTWVKDPETREMVLMDLIRPRDTYQFFVEHGELKVYKTLDTPFFSTGKLILGPYEEKGKQHVGQDILVFYVDVGNLLCTLHESPYIITTGDSFYVPSGNYYNIRNLLNEESVLLFTQIKR